MKLICERVLSSPEEDTVTAQIIPPKVSNFSEKEKDNGTIIYTIVYTNLVGDEQAHTTFTAFRKKEGSGYITYIPNLLVGVDFYTPSPIELVETDGKKRAVVRGGYNGELLTDIWEIATTNEGFHRLYDRWPVV
jgi:hypothetical protein